jgi:hypothetical protein
VLLAAYWAALLLCMGASLCLCAVSRGGKRQLELSPCLVLVVSYALYSSALPASRLLLGTSGDPAVDAAYVAPHVLGALGILLGLLIPTHHAFPSRCNASLSNRPVFLRPGLVFVAVFAGIAWQFYVLLMQVRGEVAGLLSPYASGEGYNPAGLLGSLVVITSNIAIATIVLAFPALRRGGWLRWFVAFSATVLGGLFAVRGHRNLLGFLLLPLLSLHMFARPVRLRALLLSIVGGYVFLYGLGVIRTYGVAKATSAVPKINLARSFDPLNGEFATSYSVFSRWHRLPIRREAELGATYTRDVLINLVPRQLWPTRPPTASIAFSMDYYRTRSLSFGLGYSPVVEAIANFGLVGVLPVFLIFTVLVRGAEAQAQSRGSVALLAYGYLVPAMMNWNRIDMATNVKMFLVSLTIAALLRFVVYRPTPVADTIVLRRPEVSPA